MVIRLNSATLSLCLGCCIAACDQSPSLQTATAADLSAISDDQALQFLEENIPPFDTGHCEINLWESIDLCESFVGTQERPVDVYTLIANVFRVTNYINHSLPDRWSSFDRLRPTQGTPDTVIDINQNLNIHVLPAPNGADSGRYEIKLGAYWIPQNEWTQGQGQLSTALTLTLAPRACSTLQGDERKAILHSLKDHAKVYLALRRELKHAVSLSCIVKMLPQTKSCLTQREPPRPWVE